MDPGGCEQMYLCAVLAVAAGCSAGAQVDPPATRAAEPPAPRAPAPAPGGQTRRFEGTVRAFHGAAARTRFTIDLDDGFDVSSSGELAVTYLMSVPNTARDGVLLQITMDDRRRELAAEEARVVRDKGRVLSKAARPGGFILVSESPEGAGSVEVTAAVGGETIVCTADLYVNGDKGELIAAAQRMCASLRAEANQPESGVARPEAR